MGRPRLASAMGVVGVICALTSGILAKKSIGEEVLEMYLKVLGEGGAVGETCMPFVTDDDMTIPKFWAPWAGWSAAQMEKRIREEAHGDLEVHVDLFKMKLQIQIDRPYKCLLKEALVCDDDKSQCVSCKESMKHFDCENAIRIADAESKRVKNDKTENPGPNQTKGGAPGSGAEDGEVRSGAEGRNAGSGKEGRNAGNGTEGGKAGSGTGRIVLPVGGALLAGLIALFSQVCLRETIG